MASVIFRPRELADSLAETAGCKAGLALSFEELCDSLSGSSYPDVLRRAETARMRLRAEEYEELFFLLMYKIGVTEDLYDGDINGTLLCVQYREAGCEKEFEQIRDVFNAHGDDTVDPERAWDRLFENPLPFLLKCEQIQGAIGREMGTALIRLHHNYLTLNPFLGRQPSDWSSTLELNALFQGSEAPPVGGRFIDQRFINYLAANSHSLSNVHWRQFERLTAEYFLREGYRVELGPGSNDDGVDVRVWQPEETSSLKPLCLVQCKRQKEKISKVVVKGLHADVVYEGAEYGVIVTSSELSPGARSTVRTRGYPIHEVNREAVSKWLNILKKPGTGIVRN